MNDEQLRTALLDLGDVPPPPDLVGSALAQARRHRRRTVTGLVAAVALLAAGAVTVPALVLGRPAATRTATTVPSRSMITAYSTISEVPGRVSFPPGGTSAVYAASHRGYVPARWPVAVPSPDGRLFAVSDAHFAVSDADAIGRLGVVTADRLNDPEAVRWVPGARTFGSISWSSDSTRLIYQDNGDERAAGETFDVVDARTLRRSTIDFELWGGITDSLPVVPPDGHGFALAIMANLSSEPNTLVPLLRYFDDRGVRTRDVTVRDVTGFPRRAAQPFSPDGRLAAFARGGPISGGVEIAETGSGRIVRAHVAGVFAGWSDTAHVVVAAGREVRVVDVTTGRVVAEKTLAPAGRLLVGVWLRPLDGTAPPGAVVL